MPAAPTVEPPPPGCPALRFSTTSQQQSQKLPFPPPLKNQLSTSAKKFQHAPTEVKTKPISQITLSPLPHINILNKKHLLEDLMTSNTCISVLYLELFHTNFLNVNLQQALKIFIQKKSVFSASKSVLGPVFLTFQHRLSPKCNSITFKYFLPLVSIHFYMRPYSLTNQKMLCHSSLSQMASLEAIKV